MHAILIAGIALVGLPVLLHLIMKQQPKKLVFPALRFLQQKQKTNQRKMRLRHFLLLALRMLLILLFALALFQPKIGEKYKAPLVGDFTLLGGGSFFSGLGEQPVAAVLIVDTSPSMGYRVQGVSRFDEAKRRAHEFLDDLPAGSRVAILDPNEPVATFADNLPDAHKRLDAIPAPTGYAPAITDALATAYDTLKDADKDTEATDPLPRVVVVFGDRTNASWDTARTDSLVKLRDAAAPPEAAKVAHLFVDVGADKPTNVAILNVTMKPQLLSGSAPAILNVTVRADGADVPSAKVDASLDDGAKVDAREVSLVAGAAQSVPFTFTGLTPGYHTVVFKLRDDNLAFDNERSFTFAVAETRKILTISDDPFDAAFWQLAHAKRREFDCTVVTPDEAKDFGSYEAICLLNVDEPLKLQAALRTYVEAGGKLLIAPGTRNNGYANFELMPAKLEGPMNWPQDDPKRPGGVSWKIDSDDDLKHKLMEPFLDWKKRGNVDVVRNPRKAWRHWKLADLKPSSQVVVFYDGGEEDKAKRLPAIVEGRVGQGKVLLLSTRIDPQADDDQTQTWNDYWKTTNSSWATVFPNLLIRYLVGSPDDAEYNLGTGPDVLLKVPTELAGKPVQWQFSGPGVSGQDANPKEVEPLKDGQKPGAPTSVQLRGAQFKIGPPLSLNAGEFRLKAKGDPYEQRIGLAVSKDESTLDKVPEASIEALFGPQAVIANEKELKLRDIVTTKFDQPIPLFPILLALVLIVFAAEAFISKIFYKVRR